MHRTALPTLAMSIRTIMAVLCFVTLYPIGPQSLGHAQGQNGEYLLKSAFLYNFTKFVEWPDSAFATGSTPLMVCVLGNDPFGSSLDAIAGKTIKNRVLGIKRLPSVDGIKDCQLLYVSPNQLTHTAELVRALQKAPVLTVCDVDDCAEAGIMLNMRMVENRVQLDLNLDAVQRTPLKVSSQLMKLTRIVKGAP